MPLPPIARYPLPTADCLRLNRVSWTLDPRRCALLVHDMQNYFLRPYANREPLPQAVDHLRRLLRMCRRLRIPVLYSAQPPRQPPAVRGLLADFWGPGLGSDPSDAEITGALEPHPSEPVLRKHRYSAFHGTSLAELLTAANRDQLLITGVYAHLGCLLTAVDAFMRDIQPFLVVDALADFSAEHHSRALHYAAGRCAALTVTDQVLELDGATR